MLTYLEIGERLKEARETYGFTQTDVEERVGIKRVILLNLEKGEKKIDSLLLKKLADLYGYSLMYFLESDHQKVSIPFSTEDLNDNEREAINWARKTLFNFNDLQEIENEVSLSFPQI